MSLCMEQKGKLGCLSPYFKKSGKGDKWLKNQRNRKLRRESKDTTKEHPLTNRYKFWCF